MREPTANRVQREIVVAAGPPLAWAALTQASHLAAWFGADMELDARPGGQVTARWTDGTERRGTVEEVVPLRRLSFRWAPFERSPDGRARLVRPSRVAFDLRESENGTAVTVTEDALGSASLEEAAAR